MAVNNPFKPIIKSIPAPFKNKYFLVLTVFFFWMVFFDKHGPFDNFGLSQKVRQMEADRDYYKEQIQQAREDQKDIQLNKEKFAREHYYMKKDNEDVFIFEEEEEK